MSDEQTNGPETSVRRAFRAKLSPGPSEEIIVLAADAVRAVELLGEKFDWKNIELSRIDEAQLIGDATKGEEKHIEECNRLRNRNVVREKRIEQLNAILLLCQRAAVGEQTEFEKSALANSNALQAIVDRVQRYGEVSRANVGLRRTSAQADQEIEKLRKEIDSQQHKIDGLQANLEDCFAAATGSKSDFSGPELLANTVLDTVLGLRERFDKAVAYKPAPSGPVSSAPPTGLEVLQHIIDHVEPDPGTGSPEAMTGPGKPAEARDDAMAKEAPETHAQGELLGQLDA